MGLGDKPAERMNGLAQEHVDEPVVAAAMPPTEARGPSPAS
jgi:hypothetical protein